MTKEQEKRKKVNSEKIKNAATDDGLIKEIEELKKEIEAAKAESEAKNTKRRKTTAEARTEGGELGRKQKKLYTLWKDEVLKHEETNYSKLYIVHEKKNWWKMFGHSAIMFHYDITKWANIRSVLQNDSDFGARSEEGVVNIKDIYDLDRKLTKAKIGLLYSSDDLRIYNIGKKYTEADINAMIQAEELAWSRANQSIRPKEVFPSLYGFLLRLLNNVYFVSVKMDKTARETFGAPMTKIITELMREYVVLCNKGRLTEEKFLAEVEEGLESVKGYMACLMEVRVVKLERAQSILYDVDKVKRTIAQCQPKKVE